MPNSCLIHNNDGNTFVAESGATLTVKSGATLDVQSGATVNLPAGAVTVGNVTFTGLKILAADGIDSSSAAADITLTGAVAGDRLLLAVGQLKSETAANTFVPKLSGTDFEAVVTVNDKLVQAKAAGNLSAHTFFFLFAPAAAAE